MKISILYSCTFSICVTAMVLAGCGGSQSPIAAPSLKPQTSAIATYAARGTSWMAPDAKSNDLLYVPAGPNVYVFSYPRGKHEGAFSGFNVAYSGCVDNKRGNVFIVNFAGTFSMPSGVYVYQHGGSNPIAVLSVSGPIGCSVDPTTGNLAVGVFGGGSGNSSLLVFKHATGTPKSYTTSAISKYFYCGYDDKGNLFVDGVSSPSGTGDFVLAELPKGGSSLKIVRVSQYIGWPGQVQWDGKYLTIEDASGIGYGASNVYQFMVHGTKAERVGRTNLGGAYEVHQSWIQDRTLLVPNCTPGCEEIEYYKYPGGGLPFKTIKTPTYGVVVSLASK
jgi:hypothetical protein